MSNIILGTAQFGEKYGLSQSNILYGACKILIGNLS